MEPSGVKKQDKKKKTAAGFNEIARTIFFPIYPVIARQAIEYCGIDSGFCVDAGCGPGHLAIALAAISELRIDALDTSPDMLACAEENIRIAGMNGRIRTVRGDVHALPYDDSSVDLVVSRGSLFFWDAPERAFAEIYRVIRPGGRTFVGGGFGTPALKAEIIAKMNETDPSWKDKVGTNMDPAKDTEYREYLEEAGVLDFEIVRDGSGFWIVMKK